MAKVAGSAAGNRPGDERQDDPAGLAVIQASGAAQFTDQRVLIRVRATHGPGVDAVSRTGRVADSPGGEWPALGRHGAADSLSAGVT